MMQSPRGRSIENVEGDPSTIKSRGTQITDLGEKMLTSATMLKSIANGASGQKGLAVDKIEEVVGSVHEELTKAGDMYKPTGPVVYAYGEALEDVQPVIKGRVEECESLWSIYKGLPGYYVGDYSVGARPVFLVAPAAGSPEATEADADDAAKKQAYEKWEAEAKLFDADYDTWETAFEIAATGIGRILDGKIKDDFWDKVDGFVAGALEVLTWVGLALVIAAIVIGGPVIGAIAVVVAIVVLVGTLYQKSRGDAEWKDVALAAIGVIPFGSLGKLGSIKFADNALGGLLTGVGRSAIRTEASTIIGSGRAAFRFTGSGANSIRNGAAQFARNHGSDGWVTDSIARFFTGKSVSALSTAKPADIIISTLWTELSRVDTGLSFGTDQGLWSRLSGADSNK